MSKHHLDMLEFYIASHINMKNLNSKDKTDIEDKIYIEALRTKLGISNTRKKNEARKNRK